MYNIKTTTGADLGTYEFLKYIRETKWNSFVPCDKSQAIGIVVDSIPYNLEGQNKIKTAETVIITEIDVSDYIAEKEQVVDELISSLLES